MANVLVVDDKYNAKSECVSDGSGTAGVTLSEAWTCPSYPMCFEFVWFIHVPHLLTTKASCFHSCISHRRSWGSSTGQ